MPRKVYFIDTSIFCNIVPVPGRDQDRETVLVSLVEKRNTGTLVLPVTTIIETGNFVAQLGSKGLRRSTSLRFAEYLNLICQGEAPWVLHEFAWDLPVIKDLMDGSGTGKKMHLHAESKVGLGDLAILAEMRSYIRRVRSVAVEIWTLDADLAAQSESLT